MFASWLKLFWPILSKYIEEILSPHKQGEKTSTMLERMLILFAFLSISLIGLMFDKIYAMHEEKALLSKELALSAAMVTNLTEDIEELESRSILPLTKPVPCPTATTTCPTYDESTVTKELCLDILDEELDRHILNILQGGK